MGFSFHFFFLLKQINRFDPDICLLLRLKQNRYPVMFLTTGGKEIFPDQRRNSLDSALVWARACGLRGIVCDVAPLLAGGAEVSAHFVNAVHAERMLLWTYGRENNDLAVIKQEKALGIDAIILDAVKVRESCGIHVLSQISLHTSAFPRTHKGRTARERGAECGNL